MSRLTRLASFGAAMLMTGAALAADISWRVPTSVPQGSPFYVNFLERFARNVDKLTSGRVEIQPFGAGVLVPALQVYQGVLDGTVEAGHSTPSYLVNQKPVNAIFAGFPGGMGPEAYMSWIYEGGGADKLRELRASEGLHSLIVGLGSTEIFAHSNVPITSADNLKGLKYRTSGPWAEVVRDAFGAVPTVVPPGEIYTLLQRRGVDAIEWANPSGNLPEGFHEAARYIIIPGIHQPTFLWEVVVRKETWAAVPEDLKPLIEAAAKLTTLESLVNFSHQDRLAMEKYRSGRNEIITLDDEFVRVLGEAGRDWMRKTAEARKAAGDATMADWLKDYLAYRERWIEHSDYTATR